MGDLLTTAAPDVKPPSGHDLLVVPLGGLGEIGMNCLALEQADGIIVIDCGITFPHEEIGVDIYHPEFTYLEARRERVAGVFLTHGHEDHVGALPYLLTKLKVPVWGPPHALAVAKHRLIERGLDPKNFQFITSTPRVRYAVGPFEVEPIRVTHSITDATALAVQTQAGVVVHTGDFRLDPAPADSELTDEARFAELGAAEVRLLLSDSTNVDATSSHTSETAVGLTLERLVRQAKGRVVVGMFASNVQRLRLLGELAGRIGRKIVLMGKSLELQVAWSHEIGRLAWPSDLVLPRDQAADVAREELLLLAGGTQAEHGSGLTRLAAREHPALELDAGDTVILSSRIIPGNDRPVYEMMAGFLRQGVAVKSWITDPEVHTSGHAHRHEQARMIELTRPRAFIPLHGTRHHLERHAELARERGVSEALVLENGEVARIDQEGIHRAGRVAAGRVATWNGLTITDGVLKNRRALARSGALSLSLVVDRKGRLAGQPVVRARGVLEGEAEGDDAPALRFIALEIARALDAPDAPRDDGTLAEMARLVARRAVEARTGRKPLCWVSVIRI